MANASLAARYRPQTFAQVVGQDMVKSILSRAAQEDRVAPAYLLSGTRGVGKTTVARIFAKALNCAQAPTGEPCNQCDACRRITQGGFVDVVEIDGASNRGIDDVRRLRDAVGYAPLEGRYKVFIIDEAHMLTKEAFNALLKTLEEPPPRVTFVMATTEQHKFPVTIVSRCQHFVFRQIPEARLEAHIVSVLDQEGRSWEAEAARLIARRAAGSVRDAMSLLGQVLALGDTGKDAPLTAAMTRDVLGLAGQEVMQRLLNALANHDILAVSTLVRELLLQGADMGFFLRELGALWRDLFLLKQAGADISTVLEIPDQELTRLRDMADRFPLTYIHAAWQMTLDSQRRILTSLEPAAGLELLLLNLALLPRLLPLGDLDPAQLSAGHTAVEQADTPGRSPDPSHRPEGAALSGKTAATPSPPESGFVAAQADRAAAAHILHEEKTPVQAVLPASADMSESSKSRETDDVPPWLDEIPSPADPQGEVVQLDEPPAELPVDGEQTPAFPAQANVRAQTAPESPLPSPVGTAGTNTSPVSAGIRWQDFLDWVETQSSTVPVPLLRQFDGQLDNEELTLRAHSRVVFTQIRRPPLLAEVEKLVEAWGGVRLKLTFLPPTQERRTEAEWRAIMQEHPVITALSDLYSATLLTCIPNSRTR